MFTLQCFSLVLSCGPFPKSDPCLPQDALVYQLLVGIIPHLPAHDRHVQSFQHAEDQEPKSTTVVIQSASSLDTRHINAPIPGKNWELHHRKVLFKKPSFFYTLKLKILRGEEGGRGSY